MRKRLGGTGEDCAGNCRAGSRVDHGESRRVPMVTVALPLEGFLLSFSTQRLLGACQSPGHREPAPPAGQRGICSKLGQLASTDCQDFGHSDAEKSLPATKSP